MLHCGPEGALAGTSQARDNLTAACSQLGPGSYHLEAAILLHCHQEAAVTPCDSGLTTMPSDFHAIQPLKDDEFEHIFLNPR